MIYSPSLSHRLLKATGRTPIYILSLLILVSVLTVLRTQWRTLSQSKKWMTLSDSSERASRLILKDTRSFKRFEFLGFDADLLPGDQISLDDFSCTSAIQQSSLFVQDSFSLEDDLFEIARDLDDHPMVQYPLDAFAREQKTSSLAKIVNSSWNHLASSCTYLESYEIHLCVSRVIFRPARPKDKVIINFLRGRVFDQDWNHIHGYDLRWQDRIITFPLVFDVGTAFKLGGQTYGPEDPRIIVERVPGAEPVIVFNMAMPELGWRRAMYIFRPFSNHTTVLTIHGIERPKKEKNWTPFFPHNPNDVPNDHVHFIWRFAPLTILRCSLVNGFCTIVYKQTVPQVLLDQYSFKNASIRGGTQFVPVPRPPTIGHSSDVQAFISVARHHVERVGDLNLVGKPGYRPEIALLLMSGDNFYLDYVTGPLDFGAEAVMNSSALEDAGVTGRIMIANSIVSWHSGVSINIADDRPYDAGSQNQEAIDVLTLTLSVDDATCQVLRIAGLLAVLRTLPSMTEFFRSSTETRKPLQKHTTPESRSLAAWRIRSCTEEAARVYTLEHSKSYLSSIRHGNI